MAMYSNGKLVDSSLVFSEGQALPSSTSVNSTNAVFFGGAQSGKLVVNVAASTAISIADGKGLTIKIEYGTTSTPTSVLYDTIYSHTASGGNPDAWSAGDLICQYTIPADKAATYSYAELVYTTTANESGEKLDAWISIIT